MKWKGRPVSLNMEDRRKKKSPFTKSGKQNYNVVVNSLGARIKQRPKKKAPQPLPRPKSRSK